MAGYLALDGAHRPDDPFLWPDVAVAAFLAIRSALPARHAPTALLFAFGWAGGVLTVSVFSYVVRGEFAWPNLGLVLIAVAMAALLARHVTRDPTRGRRQASSAGSEARSVGAGG